MGEVCHCRCVSLPIEPRTSHHTALYVVDSQTHESTGMGEELLVKYENS